MARLVSILITSFNAERWITETIESALAQTWPNKEIIIVDDGSRDRTLEIAHGYQSGRVKVLSQENRGANAARNRALEAAQGDSIQWLDADDLLAPDKIERQMAAQAALSDSKVLLTASWAKFFFRPYRARFHPDILWNDLWPLEWLMATFRENAWMNPATWLVSRTLTQVAGPWDERLVRDQDGEYVCRLVSKSSMVRFVSEAKCYYRQGNPRSLSRTLSARSLASMLLAKRLAFGYLRCLEDSKRTRAACLASLNRFLRYTELDDLLIRQVKDLVHDLGGEMSPPYRTRRYRFVAKAFGTKIANRLKVCASKGSYSLRWAWDKLLSKLGL